jgi:hypothetical protein
MARMELTFSLGYRGANMWCYIEIGSSIDDAHGTQQDIQIPYALISNQSITDFLRYIVSDIDKFTDNLYPGVFSSSTNYLWTNNKNDKSAVTFTNVMLPQFTLSLFFEVTLLSFLISSKNTWSY